MAKMIPSNFTRYELSEVEEEQGKRLSQLNLMYLRNLLCDSIDKKAHLTVDREQLDKYMQDEAFLHGVMTTLESLINDSEELEQQLQQNDQSLASQLASSNQQHSDIPHN